MPKPPGLPPHSRPKEGISPSTSVPPPPRSSQLLTIEIAGPDPWINTANTAISSQGDLPSSASRSTPSSQTANIGGVPPHPPPSSSSILSKKPYDGKSFTNPAATSRLNTKRSVTTDSVASSRVGKAASIPPSHVPSFSRTIFGASSPSSTLGGIASRPPGDAAEPPQLAPVVTAATHAIHPVAAPFLPPYKKVKKKHSQQQQRHETSAFSGITEQKYRKIRPAPPLSPAVPPCVKQGQSSSSSSVGGGAQSLASASSPNSTLLAEYAGRATPVICGLLQMYGPLRHHDLLSIMHPSVASQSPTPASTSFSPSIFSGTSRIPSSSPASSSIPLPHPSVIHFQSARGIRSSMPIPLPIPGGLRQHHVRRALRDILELLATVGLLGVIDRKAFFGPNERPIGGIEPGATTTSHSPSQRPTASSTPPIHYVFLSGRSHCRISGNSNSSSLPDPMLPQSILQAAQAHDTEISDVRDRIRILRNAVRISAATDERGEPLGGRHVVAFACPDSSCVGGKDAMTSMPSPPVTTMTSKRKGSKKGRSAKQILRSLLRQYPSIENDPVYAAALKNCNVDRSGSSSGGSGHSSSKSNGGSGSKRRKSEGDGSGSGAPAATSSGAKGKENHRAVTSTTQATGSGGDIGVTVLS